ncbi:DUF4189 domain-containing protein [Xanthomonas euvesicatoria pv. allii]|uniref:DUF4189 domain-containing protein n=1 Tax=Xanthomonas euvesicatoria TaxID=456327 RepID=UPI0024071C3D|nr:DUF4189 domain-containing protein [Xanthomonas euvesicatoria]MCP3046280.1 DUF4189 domain-containing protein [Xanthomonas euvesicatoria pv. allii]
MIKKPIAIFSCLIFFAPGYAAAQGCPVGQYQIGGQGAVACAPIPQGASTQQDPRPSGKWLKTWGAIAGDGGNNLGVSTGKLKKEDAQQVALMKCKESSQNDCSILFSYKNQCTAVSQPKEPGKIITGISADASIEVASKNAVALCRKNNHGADCYIVYTACTEPVFKEF